MDRRVPLGADSGPLTTNRDLDDPNPRWSPTMSGGIAFATDAFRLVRLTKGLAITVAPTHTMLTTSEAADLLGVSGPTLVRLLEAGEMPYEQPGRHRRVRLDDLLAYQQRARRARSAALDEMVRGAEDAGIYDLPDDASSERGAVAGDGSDEG